jgi:hypothetical protein
MDFSTIAGMAGGHAEARAIQIALKIGLFERLGAGGLNADELATAIGGNPRATAILANALTAIGLLHKVEGRISLDSSTRRYLLESSPEYLGGMILFDAELWHEWGRLEDSIRSGNPARVLFSSFSRSVLVPLPNYPRTAAYNDYGNQYDPAIVRIL